MQTFERGVLLPGPLNLATGLTLITPRNQRQDTGNNGTIRKKGEIMKEYLEKKFGQGTAFDLDYGKLLIIALLIYIAVFK